MTSPTRSTLHVPVRTKFGPGTPSDPVQALLPEDRFAPRRRRHFPALVTVGSGSGGTLRVTVLDTSSNGLLLLLPAGATASAFPARFRVYIPIEHVEFDCSVARDAGDRVGVRIVSPARLLDRPQPSRLTRKPEPKKSLLGSLFNRPNKPRGIF